MTDETFYDPFTECMHRNPRGQCPQGCREFEGSALGAMLEETGMPVNEQPSRKERDT